MEQVWGEHVTAKEALGMKLCLHAMRLLEKKVQLPKDVEARIERTERAGERSAAREGAQAAAIVPLVDTGAPLAQPADDYRCPGQVHRGRGPTWKTLVHDGNKMVNVGGTFVCRRCERSERRRQRPPATPAAALPTAAASSPDQENASVQAPAAQAAEPTPMRAGDNWSPSPRSRAAGPGLRPLPNGEAGAVSSGQAAGEPGSPRCR